MELLRTDKYARKDKQVDVPPCAVCIIISTAMFFAKRFWESYRVVPLIIGRRFLSLFLLFYIFALHIGASFTFDLRMRRSSFTDVIFRFASARRLFRRQF